MTPKRAQRLKALENQVRLMRKALPDVLKQQAMIAQQASTIARLIGENDRLRSNLAAAGVADEFGGGR